MLGVAKQALTKAIADLASKSQFAVLFGGPEPGMIKKFPENGNPVEATEAQKKSARGFLATAPVDGTPSVAVDFIAALRSAEKLTTKSKAIIYVGRGIISDDTPERVLQKITAENKLKVKVSVLGIAPYPAEEDFLKKLATANGGTYTRIEE